MFRTPFDIVSTYAWNEYYGRSPYHFREYPDSIRAITADAIRRMAAKYLDAGSFTYTVVGDTNELAKYKSAKGFSLEKLVPRTTIVPDSIASLP
jgi:predicted Zn-dependent peptidase